MRSLSRTGWRRELSKLRGLVPCRRGVLQISQRGPEESEFGESAHVMEGRGICVFTLPAIPAAATTARVQFRYWLDRLGWPATFREDIEYVVSEAIGNVVEHAYADGVHPRPLVVEAVVEELPGRKRRIRVRITDHGRWRSDTADAPPRHLGLRLMRGLMDEVRISPGDAARGGTEVVLLSPPVPPP